MLTYWAWSTSNKGGTTGHKQTKQTARPDTVRGGLFVSVYT